MIAAALNSTLARSTGAVRRQVMNPRAEAARFRAVFDRPVRGVPIMRGRTEVNFVHAPSTRTRISFELAEKRLSADIVNFSSSTSSLTKGETLRDTAENLAAMKIDMLIIRHSSAGSARYLANVLDCSIINAGDGRHAHGGGLDRTTGDPFAPAGGDEQVGSGVALGHAEVLAHHGRPGGAQHDLALHGLAAGQRGLGQGDEVGRAHHLGQQAADGLVGPHAEQGAAGRVHADDDLVAVDGHRQLSHLINLVHIDLIQVLTVGNQLGAID